MKCVCDMTALRLFCDNPRYFDLIITDMNMPKMTGKELAGRLQSVRPDIPIILCTGFSERITQEQAAAMRLDALMTKPVCKAQMAATVRHVLESARPKEV
jgi:CheY-like chemotaxis protein